MESKVDETLSDSRGSFLKTSVMPFWREKTNITKPESRISDNVMARGIVKPDAAASGCGDANDGFVDKYVFSGFACTLVFRVKKASPEYDILKMPLNLSSAKSPISRISKSGGVSPKFNSVTIMSSTMMGGFGDLLRAAVSISLAREVSAMSGDQLKLKAMMYDVIGHARPLR
jgi:hypothetical protein